ncbi:MAG: hypothetical protein JRF62_16405 [Deltaproteobacteria bacterium]|nr:hypothetical protein [Deltaproteobacteria bacterium]
MMLLDTNGFLWALFTPEKLSRNAIREIKSSENDVAVSVVVTFWEISLKYGLGKLKMTGVTPEELTDFTGEMNPIKLLGMTFSFS